MVALACIGTCSFPPSCPTYRWPRRLPSSSPACALYTHSNLSLTLHITLSCRLSIVTVLRQTTSNITFSPLTFFNPCRRATSPCRTSRRTTSHPAPQSPHVVCTSFGSDYASCARWTGEATPQKWFYCPRRGAAGLGPVQHNSLRGRSTLQTSHPLALKTSPSPQRWQRSPHHHRLCRLSLPLPVKSLSALARR